MPDYEHKSIEELRNEYLENLKCGGKFNENFANFPAKAATPKPAAFSFGESSSSASKMPFNFTSQTSPFQSLNVEPKPPLFKFKPSTSTAPSLNISRPIIVGKRRESEEGSPGKTDPGTTRQMWKDRCQKSESRIESFKRDMELLKDENTSLQETVRRLTMESERGIFGDFKRILKDDNFKNFTIIVGDEEFKVSFLVSIKPRI
jgi:hypothetical protein